MNIDLSGRVAIVTGGANGIGRETALVLAAAGAAIAVWDVGEAAGRVGREVVHGQRRDGVHAYRR